MQKAAREKIKEYASNPEAYADAAFFIDSLLAGRAFLPEAGTAESETVRAFSSTGTAGSGRISLEEAVAAAQRNGIDTRMFKLEYGGADPRYFGSSSFTPTDLTLESFKIARTADGRAIITLFDNGLTSAQAAVETIAHEINHIRGVFQSGRITTEKAAEAAAEAAGQNFR